MENWLGRSPKDLTGTGPYLYGDLCVFTKIQISPRTANHSRSLCRSLHRSGIEKHQDSSSGALGRLHRDGEAHTPTTQSYVCSETASEQNRNWMSTAQTGVKPQAATCLLGLERSAALPQLRDRVPGRGVCLPLL